MRLFLRHPLVWLFGGWMRTGDMLGRPFCFVALRRRSLTHYRQTFFGAIDPYGRFLTGPTTFVPGRLLRRGAPRA